MPSDPGGIFDIKAQQSPIEYLKMVFRGFFVPAYKLLLVLIKFPKEIPNAASEDSNYSF